MSLTNDKMPENNSNMMENQFFGKPHEDSKECAMIGLIKNQMHDLEDELNEAKLRFADATLDKDNWSMAKEREIACKVVEGQIAILAKLQNAYEDMLSPMPSMAMAG